jgi:putative transposase
MRLNAAGKIVQLQWTTLPERFSRLRLDQFVIMPNYIHGILILTEEAPEKDIHSRIIQTIGGIVRIFKGASTHHIRSSVASNFSWQQGFYDSVVWNEHMLRNLRQYIVNNPIRWTQDKLYNSLQ